MNLPSLRPTLLALCLALPGCGASFTAATPPGFVDLGDDPSERYDYRAITPDGLVMAVRDIEHDPRGELTFWTQAVENHMRQKGGYALLQTRDVKSADGLGGKQLRFGHDEGSKPHLYFVTIFVTDKRIYVVEAGGTKELMDRHAQQIDWAIENFHVK